jgi:hypothetical protein
MTLKKEITPRNANNACVPYWMFEFHSFNNNETTFMSTENKINTYVGVRTPWFQVKLSRKYLMIYWNPNVNRKEGELIFLEKRAWEF